ncbi:CBS domain-containing protein [Catellatospora sp. KI3]|uniref:CBS domain-containing protein n=1 Tax=Catellatospora sp. KI3 TaxID=3041620 RepID=UPI0024830144|nr:CBS domain-containing protein [Catellatospora sp. KI3]MDI1464788.1 CBS domain-containing protein [Catellatospora sp. KI3]
MSVRDLMTRDAATVGLDTPYAEIAGLLARQRVNAVAVHDDLRRLAGIVTEGDLLRRVEFSDEPVGTRPLLERPSRRAARHKAEAAVASQLMTAPALTVPPETSAADAARLMAEQRVKQLPVVDRQGRMIGMLTRRDLLQVFRRRDSDIRADIAETVLHVLRLEPHAIAVAVDHGVVTLTGAVHQASKSRIAARLTGTVPGVTQVIDQLTFDIDDDPAAPQPAASAAPPNHPGPQFVVGVDGSDDARQALRWSVAAAATRGGSVLAIAVRDPRDGNPDQCREMETMLSGEIRDLPDRHRVDVVIRTAVLQGRPAHVLMAQAADATMLVLGRYGAAGARRRLGSVSAECIRGASVPVLVVPHRTAHSR